VIQRLAAFPRFVLHDLRLSARALASMFGSLSPRRLAALIALVFVALHVAAYPVAGWLIGIEDGPDGAMRLTAIVAGGAALVFPWIVSQSIADFSRTLFGRSDLELILASPVDAHALLAARALSISVGAVASVGMLLAPLADVAALRGHPHWLALYPALLAAGLAGTGFAIILSMGLFLAAGPRRARLFGQIAATAIGASAVLGAQIVAMLPSGVRTTILTALAPPANVAGAAQGALWTPVRAAAGDPQALLIWTAFGALVFALACALFGERFAQAAIASAGAPAHAGGASSGATRG
jgi:ABC-2 type transport system permease protein